MAERANSNEESMITVEEDEQYAVEAIRSHKVLAGVTYYLVKWLDYPQEQNTWEPAENLVTVPKLIEDYMNIRAHLKKEKVPRTPKSKNEPEHEKEDKLLKSAHKNKPNSREEEIRSPKKVNKNEMVPEQTKENRKNKIADVEKSKEVEKMQIEKDINIKESGRKSSHKEINSPKLGSVQQKIIEVTPQQYSIPAKPEKKKEVYEKKDIRPDQNIIPAAQPEPNKKKKVDHTNVAVQFPEKLNIRRVNHMVFKNNEFYYEVEYSGGKAVDLLPSNIILQECPHLIVQYFERSLLSAPLQNDSKKSF